MKFTDFNIKKLLITLCFVFCILDLNKFSYSISISTTGKTNQKLALSYEKERKVFKAKHKAKARNNKFNNNNKKNIIDQGYLEGIGNKAYYSI